MKFCRPRGLEIAFAGRSMSASRRDQYPRRSRASLVFNTPGRTQELNFFVPDGYSGEAGDLPPMALVDMPGYGYAQAPKEQVDDWTKLVFDYLKGRVTLKRVYLLIDARHGVKTKDDEVMDLLDRAAVSYQLVLTKTDKIHVSGMPKLLAILGKIRKLDRLRYTGDLPEDEGLDELRQAICETSALPYRQKNRPDPRAQCRQ